uniref:Uncharacterized protein n=1 Tax=Arundo donax TaxID=35708 RepID=A0A0A9GKQ0_ARUDO
MSKSHLHNTKWVHSTQLGYEVFISYATTHTTVYSTWQLWNDSSVPLVALCSPSQLCREILLDERHVVGLHLLHVYPDVALAVQVILVEHMQPLEVLLVLIVHQLHVGSMLVQGVEGVISDDEQPRGRKGGLVLLGHQVHVIVMAP